MILLKIFKFLLIFGKIMNSSRYQIKIKSRTQACDDGQLSIINLFRGLFIATFARRIHLKIGLINTCFRLTVTTNRLKIKQIQNEIWSKHECESNNMIFFIAKNLQKWIDFEFLNQNVIYKHTNESNVEFYREQIAIQ